MTDPCEHCEYCGTEDSLLAYSADGNVLLCDTCRARYDAEEVSGNPVVRTTDLRAYPGFVVRQYTDGMYDAAQVSGIALSPGYESFAEAVAWVRDGAQ